MLTNEKLALLRQKLADNNLDAYYINTADPHQSEYVSAAFRSRAWISGFTGSAGTAVVTRESALLWTDGRYFIQAEKQIAGSEFKLMKMATPGYPTVEEWLLENLREGARLGLNGEVVSQAAFERLQNKFAPKKVELVNNLHLVEDIWSDRPALPSDPAFLHKIEFTGLSAAEKIAKVREKMAAEKVDATLLVTLDDICWLYNFRGNDVVSNPVVLSFAIIEQNKASLFIHDYKRSPEFDAAMAEAGVTLYGYDEILSQVEKLAVKRLALNKAKVSACLFAAIPEGVEIINRSDYVYDMKACQSEHELACTRKAMLRDSGAITEFIHYVKTEVANGGLDELNVAAKLHEIRTKLPLFIEESFNSISAYGPNAAMMHYGPTQDNFAALKPEGFYLIDCGSQFHDGTTDVTRTLACGPLTQEMIRDYTLTLKGHIDLAKAVFLEGVSGYYLDILARHPLWEVGLDYKCGTGHGVGYVLGVHEGPQRISKNFSTIAMEPGMIITNEPGVYKEGKYGIRLENDYVVAKAFVADGDQFLKLDCLSFVPFDREAIDKNLLDEDELQWLNNYHRDCYEFLKDQLPAEVAEWLKEVCAPL